MSGAGLRAWRERMGWSQSRAAAELNLPTKTFQNYEQGRTAIPGPVERLAAYIERGPLLAAE
jgi:DNA-binding transcriptional regulator YiaG